MSQEKPIIQTLYLVSKGSDIRTQLSVRPPESSHELSPAKSRKALPKSLYHLLIGGVPWSTETVLSSRLDISMPAILESSQPLVSTIRSNCVRSFSKVLVPLPVDF